VSDTAQGLQEMLNRLERFCKWSGMEVNVKKTKVCSYDYGKGKEAADVRELTYNGQLLAEVYDDAGACSIIAPTTPFPYLGYSMTLTGDWRAEMEKIMGKTRKLKEALTGHKFTRSQGVYLFSCSVHPVFRYSCAVTPWSRPKLNELMGLWVATLKQAMHLSPNLSRAVFLYPREWGGQEMMNTYTVYAKEMTGHLQRCAQYDDALREQLVEVVEEAMEEACCDTMGELVRRASTYTDLQVKRNSIAR
jgi:hypothetical protein